MELCTTVAELHSMLGGHSPAFVPTMGALHDGHAALIRRARETTGRGGQVVVSIFVNPTQFAPHEDLSRYPRQLEKDRLVCQQAGADVIFAPAVSDLYPNGLETVSDTFSMPPLPDVATKPELEDRFRSTHFAGVIKVVARLFDVVQPSLAFFGEKDFQQLRVITDMVQEQTHLAVGHDRRQRWPDLQIVPCHTIRERDGLAMSSRNVYLSPEQRKTALTLWRAISEAKQESTPAAAENVMHLMMEEANFVIDYAAVRDARTLLPVERFDRPCRALIAARLDSVRLIDNMPIGPHQETDHA